VATAPLLLAGGVGTPAVGVPDPLSGLGRQIVGAFGDAIVRGLATAASSTFGAMLDLLNTASGVQVTHGWFASSRGRAVTGTASAIAGSVLVLCLLFAAVQGAVNGQASVALKAALIEVPRAVVSAAALVAVTQLLLDATDIASGALVRNVPADLNRFSVTYGQTANLATMGVAGALFTLLFFLGSALLLVELLIRSSLIYFLVAASPIVFAARVWPEARHAYRRFIELGLALILSKLAIALALGLGAAALAGDGSGGDVGNTIGSLATGAVLVIVAAMTPFVLLKLIPVVEGAVVGQGISRSPARAAQTGAQLAYYGQGLSRMSGTNQGGAPPAVGAAEGTGTAGAASAVAAPIAAGVATAEAAKSVIDHVQSSADQQASQGSNGTAPAAASSSASSQPTMSRAMPDRGGSGPSDGGSSS
jgi:hypothetical protein